MVSVWTQGQLEAVSAQLYTEKRGADGCLSRELDGDHWGWAIPLR